MTRDSQGKVRSLKAAGFRVSLERPLVMGIINVTPDSFSDGGRAFSTSQAIALGHGLAEQGADLLDVGGESSRPGAMDIGADEEIRRTIPVIRELSKLGVPISIDTTKPVVMRAALDAGAVMINDIRALRAEEALRIVAEHGAAVCLMHMQGEPRTMQAAPHYIDVVAEVASFLARRAEHALGNGIDPEQIVIDPGFGFGKTAAHNLELLRRLHVLTDLGFAVLAGLSRKSTLGEVTGRPVDQRVHASIAAALIAVQNGASIVRVHDVAATRDALAVLTAVGGKSASAD